MLRRRKKTKTLVLGDSLSSNIYVTQDPNNSLLISWVGASSSLDGWVFIDTCVDRLPLLLEKPDCLRYLGFEVLETDYNYVLIGEEDSLRNKVSIEGEDPHHIRTWYDLFPSTYVKVYKPLLNWCQIIKILRNRSKVSRIYANIQRIDPEEKTVLLEGGAVIEYENLVSSVPQDLLLSRLSGVDPRDIFMKYPHLPYSISLIVGKTDQKITDGEVIVYALGKKRYIASHVILLGVGINSLKNEYVLIYVLTPLRHNVDKTEILVKNLSELKNIGINVRDAIFIRSFIEKYGKIFKPEKNSYDMLLKKLGIKVIGRYGSWEELSICNIISNLKFTHEGTLA